MAKSKNYDFNISSNGEKVFLSAYELWFDITSRSLYMNASKYYTISFKLDHSNDDALSYLLGNSIWEEVDWEDYDEWVGKEDLIKSGAPIEIKSWVENLPEYDMEEK